MKNEIMDQFYFENMYAIVNENENQKRENYTYNKRKIE